ncbi:WD40-repeat-containing domain protein, partial [Pterulicium gracile]
LMSADTSKFLVSEAHLVLDSKRKEKSKRIASRGDPIKLANAALPLAMQIEDQSAWIAEATGLVRCIDLKSGGTQRLYKYHKAPVTCLAFHQNPNSINDGAILFSGSWDKVLSVSTFSIKTTPLSITPKAHSDFVKSLLIIAPFSILASSGSDKIVRFWDFSDPASTRPLKSVGSVSAHLRPVENMAFDPKENTLYTADTMGVIMSWTLQKEVSQNGEITVRATLLHEFGHHRTRVNEMHLGNGMMWTASSDDTIQVLPIDSTQPGAKHLTVSLPAAARCLLPLPLTPLGSDEAPYILSSSGDTLYLYELSFPQTSGDNSAIPEAELIQTFDDVHWHEITAVKLWMKKEEVRRNVVLVPWIVTTSLDGTIRRWKLIDLISPPPPALKEQENKTVAETPKKKEEEAFKMSEEEERELAELMDD